ncbi:MAG: hypothetical protein J6W52_03380 [Bacteroidaceae bacterium]|nr:hypothetical protein [Bacteroidaceae bacterium]
MITTASTTERQRKRAYLRLHPQLVDRLRTEASRRHTSFNSYVEGILYDAVYNDTDAEISAEQLVTLQKARNLTTEDVHEMEEKEFCSPEDLRLLLYKTVDDLYVKI